jgi:hypothetical protein
MSTRSTLSLQVIADVLQLGVHVLCLCLIKNVATASGQRDCQRDREEPFVSCYSAFWLSPSTINLNIDRRGMIKRMKFLHLRIRTFMVSAFGTIVVIGFRTSFLVKETKIMAMTMHTNLEWKIPVLPKHRYDWSKSTEENYKAETSFCGKYGNVREHLDHTYHSTYTKSRQLLQDSIIDTLLHNTRIVDKAGMSCATPTQPWIVFTAGAMGAG